MISTEYIEMNQALPQEILDLWEPDVGDRILNKTALNYNKKKGREILDPVEFLSIEHFSASCEDRIKEWAIPLYRQEDLQVIAMKIKGYGVKELGLAYHHWLKGDYSDLVDGWLDFLMETCYGKRWNTDKKMWVVI